MFHLFELSTGFFLSMPTYFEFYCETLQENV